MPLIPEDADDRTIVSLLLARKPHAMEWLYDRWSSLTYSLALSIINNQAEAEKVVLEAYLTLWRRPELALEHYDSLQAYLCALVSCDARLRYLRSSPTTRVRAVTAVASGATHPTTRPSQSLEPAAGLWAD
jgi:DNA-directed RNA polymerase specialized sigma24 family protein